jgi:hypothetical protein
MSARGLEVSSLLPFSNPEKEASTNRRESYNPINKAIRPEESQALLENLQKNLIESR